MDQDYDTKQPILLLLLILLLLIILILLTPAIDERDPDNRLLSQSPRLRLSPFQLRDHALALSCLLIDKIGGPPVRP